MQPFSVDVTFAPQSFNLALGQPEHAPKMAVSLRLLAQDLEPLADPETNLLAAFAGLKKPVITRALNIRSAGKKEANTSAVPHPFWHMIILPSLFIEGRRSEISFAAVKES